MKLTYAHSSLGLQPDKNPVIDDDLTSFSTVPVDKSPVIDDDLSSFNQSPAGLALIIVAAVGALSAIIYGISRLFKGGKK